MIHNDYLTTIARKTTFQPGFNIYGKPTYLVGQEEKSQIQMMEAMNQCDYLTPIQSNNNVVGYHPVIRSSHNSTDGDSHTYMEIDAVHTLLH
jgi:hypothetical protein